jgi:hypothetical protein
VGPTSLRAALCRAVPDIGCRLVDIDTEATTEEDAGGAAESGAGGKPHPPFSLPSHPLYPIVHGVDIPLAAPVGGLFSSMAHPDAFLYVVLRNTPVLVHAKEK